MKTEQDSAAAQQVAFLTTLLAHLLSREAEYYFSQQQADKSRLKAQQAIHIFDYLDQLQATLSLERQAVVTKLEHILQTLAQQQ